MTFLNPFVLFGLAAAAIPILIHLFNIRKLRTIEFSTLTFLKELNKNKIRKIKIRQWLLLALRTLLILLIVLAFSRPALKGNFGSAGTHTRSTLIILLDNTASMSMNNERGKFLSQAQIQALKIIAMLQENDEVYFLRLSDLPDATTEEPTHDYHRLESLVRETDISYAQRSIEEGIRLASRLLHRSKNFNKELYVITDGQLSTLRSEAKQDVQNEQLFEPQVKVFYTQLSQRHSENISVEGTVIPPSLFRVNKPFVLKTVVKNYGTTTVSNHLVSVVFDGNRVMQKSVTLSGGESATIDFNLTPTRPGIISGFVEMEGDAFDPDDRSFFSVNIPDRIKLTIVAAEEKYSHYIVAALNAGALSNTSTLLSFSVIAPAQFIESTLSRSDVVILSGIKSLPPHQQEVINDYLINGGNVLFFPSSDTAAIAYDYLKSFGLTNFILSKAGATFDKVDLQFPIFQGMFEQGLQKNTLRIESPQISVTVNAGTETDLRSIISLSTGRNFLWLRNIEKGKILGSSLPVTTEWSDLPLKGFFVPLIYQSVLYLSSPLNTANEQKYFVGEQIDFNSSMVKKGSAISPVSIQLFDTESRKVPITPYVKTNHAGISETMFTFERPQTAGIYIVRSKTDTLLALPINVTRRESDGSHANDGQVNEVFSHVGIAESAVTQLQPDADVAATVTQSRFGLELWKYILLAALIIAMIEMMIARESKQQ